MAKLKPTLPVDFPILFLSLSLLAFGLIMVLSAGAVSGFNAKQNTFYYVFQQMKWTVIGAFFAFVTIKVPYMFWRKLAGVGILISIGLLITVIYTDAGVETSGATRWINISGINVQPTEIMKLALVVFYAHILDRYPIKRGKNWRIPLGILIPVTILVLALVYKQPDLGTTMVLAMTSAAMLFQTEIPTMWFIVAIPILGAPLSYFIHGYQWERIVVWLDPWKYASDAGYQITNAAIAFGSGGLFGVGLGRSMQKYGFLPENHTDMIFAIVGEELGLVGTLFLLLIIISLYARAYQVIRECPDRFGRLLGFGLTSSLAIQSTVNIAVVTGVIPVTGITLPLISYGGSSLIITLIELGLILNISRYRNSAPSSPTAKNPPNVSV